MPSLALQISIYFNTYYLPFYFLLTLAMLLYKGFLFPYPPMAYALEVVSLLTFLGVEASRMFLGNKTDQIMSLASFLGLSTAALFGYVFFLLWQTFVLLLDVILGAIGLCFIVLEGAFGTVHLVGLARC